MGSDLGLYSSQGMPCPHFMNTVLYQGDPCGSWLQWSCRPGALASSKFWPSSISSEARRIWCEHRGNQQVKSTSICIARSRSHQSALEAKPFDEISEALTDSNAGNEQLKSQLPRFLPEALLSRQSGLQGAGVLSRRADDAQERLTLQSTMAETDQQLDLLPKPRIVQRLRPSGAPPEPSAARRSCSQDPIS